MESGVDGGKGRGRCECWDENRRRGKQRATVTTRGGGGGGGWVGCNGCGHWKGVRWGAGVRVAGDGTDAEASELPRDRIRALEAPFGGVRAAGVDHLLMDHALRAAEGHAGC